jgi:hypothetical protein
MESEGCALADLWKQTQRAANLLAAVRAACEEGLGWLDELAHVAASQGDGLAIADRAWAEVEARWETWRASSILQEVPAEYGGRYCKGTYVLPLGPVPLRIGLPTLLPFQPGWNRAEYVAEARTALIRTLDSLRTLEVQVETARQEAEQLV